jgi:hypothetical protein
MGVDHSRHQCPVRQPAGWRSPQPPNVADYTLVEDLHLNTRPERAFDPGQISFE